MFGIGGGELFFILLVVLMLFGSDKIPDIARALGKGMAQLKNATNEIKSEIQKGTQEAGLDMNTLTGGVSEEIAKAKEDIEQLTREKEDIKTLADFNVNKNTILHDEIKHKEDEVKQKDKSIEELNAVIEAFKTEIKYLA